MISLEHIAAFLGMTMEEARGLRAKRNRSGSIKNADRIRRVLRRLYGKRCLCCGLVPERLEDLTIDHIVPVAEKRRRPKGDIWSLANLQLLCPDCNRNKGSDTIDYRPERIGGRPVRPKAPSGNVRPSRGTPPRVTIGDAVRLRGVVGC